MASITVTPRAAPCTSDATAAYPSPNDIPSKHDSNGHASSSYGKNKTDYSEDTPPGLLFKLDLSNLVPSNKPKVTGDEKTHVFYLMGASPFCRAEQAPMDIRVVIPVGPIQIYLTGRVEFVNKIIDMPTYIRFPLRPDTLIGSFTGRLQDNTTTFESAITIGDLGPIVTGSLKLVLSGSSVQVHEQHARKWVTLQGDITVLETQYEFDVKVFPWAGIDTHTSLNFEAAAR